MSSKSQLLSLMSFLVTIKKTNKVYVWLAVDRDGNKVVDFEVSIVRDFASYLPIAMRLQSSYEIEISMQVTITTFMKNLGLLKSTILLRQKRL